MSCPLVVAFQSCMFIFENDERVRSLAWYDRLGTTSTLTSSRQAGPLLPIVTGCVKMGGATGRFQHPTSMLRAGQLSVPVGKCVLFFQCQSFDQSACPGATLTGATATKELASRPEVFPTFSNIFSAVHKPPIQHHQLFQVAALCRDCAADGQRVAESQGCCTTAAACAMPQVAPGALMRVGGG